VLQVLSERDRPGGHGDRPGEPGAAARSVTGCRGGNAQPGVHPALMNAVCQACVRPRPAACRGQSCGHPGLGAAFSPGNAPEPAGKPGYSRNDVLRLHEIRAL